MPTTSPRQPDVLSDDQLSLHVARLRLQITPENPAPRADHLRAAVAAIRPDVDLLHQYGQDGLIYRYPRVLYRVVNRTPVVVAVDEGAEAVSSLTLAGRDLRLGATTRRVLSATLEVSRQDLGPTSTPCGYRLTTPWLALNQENYARFRRMTQEERQRFLDAQVANNCLSLAKSFGLRISTRLVGRADVRPVSVRLNGIEMMALLGQVEVNFRIPAGLAIGKSVAKGYGAIERIG
jgi:hypothetical protein